MVKKKMSNGQKKFNLKGQGEWCRKIRGERSIKQMADIIGVNDRTWRHWENEEREISEPAKRLLMIDQCTKISEKKSDYDLHGGWQARSIEDFAGVSPGLDFAKAVSMLADIFNSDDEHLIHTIRANLESFREQARLKKKIEYIDKRLQNIEEYNDQLVNRRTGEDRRRENLKVVNDRRNGKDRRLD